MRLVWTTDLHFNHSPTAAWDQWIAAIASAPSDGLLIGGDIAEAPDVVQRLQQIAAAVGGEIFFVLGNHDFYRGSIPGTRQCVVHAVRDQPRLIYLTDADAIELAPQTFLVGDDGWGDASTGDYERSLVRLNDFHWIEDFQHSDPSSWKSQLQALGAQSAARIEAKLLALPADTRGVLVLTHVPPFREACWYLGQTTDDNWAPFFVCGAVGQVLRRASEQRPDCQFTVLCGHTHHAGVARIAPNLIVHTGAAQYGQPGVQGVVEVTAERIELHQR